MAEDNPVALPPAGATSVVRRVLACLLKWSPWLLVLWPVWALHGLILEYAINAPFWDDFMSVPLIEKAARGTLTAHDLFAAQMEHRIAWPRAVMLVSHKLWPTDFFIMQIWFSWALLCGTLVNVGVLLRQTTGVRAGAWWPLLALAGLSLFSPVHFQIILWPMMHQVVGLAFFLTGGLAVWLARWPAWLRLMLALLCMLGATLSFTSGILMWLVLLPVIWWSAPMKDQKTRLWCAGLWLAAFAVTMALYFHDLKNEVDPAFSYEQAHAPTMSRNLAAFIADPWKSLDFAARVLGSFMGRGTEMALMDVALEIGLLLVALFTACLAYLSWRVRDAELRRRLLPWLALGAYAIGTTVAIAMGRVWLSRSGTGALSGRYVIHATPLLVALPVLLWTIGRDLAERFPAARQVIGKLLLGAGAVFVIASLGSWHYGERMMGVWSESRMQGAVNTMFYKTSCPVEHDYAGLPELARKADDLGLLKPPMLKNLRLDQFKASSGPLNADFSKWSSLIIEKADDGLYGIADGHAILRKPNKQARVVDGIFLTRQDAADGHWEIFQVAQAAALPFYLYDKFQKDLEWTAAPTVGVRESLSSFHARFKLDAIPKGVLKIAAWAYDYHTRRVAIIPGIYELDTVNGTVKTLGPDAVDGIVQRDQRTAKKPKKS